MVRTHDFLTSIWKSTIVAAAVGVYGLVSINQQLLGLSMEPLPPFLGNPDVFQSFATCNGGPFVVCPPLVTNSYSIAATDYLILFGICFVILLPLFYKLRLYSDTNSGFLSRNVLVILLLIIVLIPVYVSASDSVTAGASFTKMRWCPMSYVIVLNSTLYSGNATNDSEQGTAHLDLILANGYCTSINYSFSLSLVQGLDENLSTNLVPFFQCSTSTDCSQVSSVTIPPYSLLNLTGTATALYFGKPVERGEYYVIRIITMGESDSLGALLAL